MAGYYNSSVSCALTKKLLEKGLMPSSTSSGYNPYTGSMESSLNITYADVFDWLMKQGIYPSIIQSFGGYCNYILNIEETGSSHSGEGFDCWKKAAIAMIEKALTLI